MPQILLYPKFKALNHAGQPLSGGKVYTYIAGTTTNKATYPTAADALAGTNELDNPVILDADGEATIYLDGSYKILLKDSADITQWTRDNVQHDMTPAEIDDLSATDTAARTTSDPYPAASLSKATTLQEEIQQLRYLIAQITGETYWYIDPDSNMVSLAPYDVLTTRGDILRRNASAPGRLALGTAGQHLISDGTDISWGVTPGLYGYLDRPQFLHSSDTDILIEPGAYHHSGTVDQLVYWNSQLTFTASNISAGTADQIVYVYLDDSAIVTNGTPLLDNTCFVDSNTGPVWSDAKHGWYGTDTTANDRCIFACSADATDDLLPWYHDGGSYVEYDLQVEDMSDTDIDLVWTDIVLSIPDFGDNGKAVVTFYGNGTNVIKSFYRKNGSSSTGHLIAATAGVSTQSVNTRIVAVDDAQTIEVVNNGSDSSTLAVYTNGFYLPRGM